MPVLLYSTSYYNISEHIAVSFLLHLFTSVIILNILFHYTTGFALPTALHYHECGLHWVLLLKVQRVNNWCQICVGALPWTVLWLLQPSPTVYCKQRWSWIAFSHFCLMAGFRHFQYVLLFIVALSHGKFVTMNLFISQETVILSCSADCAIKTYYIHS